MAETDGTEVERIEVTPEMIEAGGQVIENHYEAYPSIARDTAQEVFWAMMNKFSGGSAEISLP